MSENASSHRAAWLRRLYLTRAAFSLVWVVMAFTAAKGSPALAAVLLIVYPAWDALANLLDVRMSGGAQANRPQVLNIWISALVALAVAVSSVAGLHADLLVLGVWAVLAGLLQLATAVRRRRGDRSQWAMMLSGAQSALAGTFFITQQGGPAPVLQTIAGYATVGAAYFLISGLVLWWSHRRAAAMTQVPAGRRV